MMRRISARSDGMVEGAVHRADDVDLGSSALRASGLAAPFRLLGAELGPEPVDGAIARLPLILVDRARQEAHEVRTLGRYPAADHLGDAAGHDDGRHVGVLGGGRPAQRAFGAGHRELVLGEAGDDDRQFMRRQAVGVVQHRRHRQVLAADRAVDDDPQAPDRREGVDGPPVAAGSVVIENQHGSGPHRYVRLSTDLGLPHLAEALLGPRGGACGTPVQP